MVRAILFDALALFYGPTGPELLAEVLRTDGLNVTDEEVADAVERLPEEIRAARREIRTEEQENDYHPAMLPELLRILGVAHPTDAQVLRLVEMLHEYHAFFSMYPETLPVLEELRKRGLKLGVVANWEPSLPRFIREFELDGYFDAIVSSMAEGIAKPDPILFHRALKRLGVKAEDALHAGPHMKEDVTGALQAGIRPVWLNRTGISTGHEVLTITDLRGLLMLAQKAGE